MDEFTFPQTNTSDRIDKQNSKKYICHLLRTQPFKRDIFTDEMQVSRLFYNLLICRDSLSQQATEALQRSHISKQSTGCELRNNIFGINACPIYSICPFPNGVFTYSNIRPDVEDFFCPFSSNSKLRLYTLFIQ